MMQEAAPVVAANPWLNPSFLLPAATTVILIIVWLVRGEFQSKANMTRQKEFEESITSYVDEVKSEHRAVKAAFYAHTSDTRVHHNEEMFKEFRVGLERRFTSIDTTLREISQKLDVHRTQG